ncbi:MAG: hypothetical protein V1851_03055 [Patescibacteria group bacterium]
MLKKLFTPKKIIFILSLIIILGGFKTVNASNVFSSWEEILSRIASTMLGLSALILSITGMFFDTVLSATINFKSLVGEIGMVNIGWTIFRDLSNMLFIFILLFASIGTILGLSSFNFKNLIKDIILIALLINFSLFATGLVIDASNILALGFYNKLIINTGSQENGAIIENTEWDRGISTIFAKALNIKSIYDIKNIKVTDTEKGKINDTNIFTIGLLGSIFLLVTAFIFFAAGVLFLKRTIILIMLMMVSPLAFMAMALPQTKKFFGQWQSMLLSEAFFAPIYLMIIYIVARGITSESFRATLSGAGNGDFANAFIGGPIVVIINFFLITGIMVAALVSASNMGASGAKEMLALGNRLKNWGEGALGKTAGFATFGAAGRLGRSVIGAGSNLAAEKLQNMDIATTWGGKIGLKGLRSVANSSFDFRNTSLGKNTVGSTFKMGEGIKGGYKDKTETRRKSEIKYAQSLKGKTQSIGRDGNKLFDSNNNPIMIDRSEAYGQKIFNRTEKVQKGDFGYGRSILSTVFANTGTDRLVAENLVDIPRLNKELKEVKNKLKKDNEKLRILQNVPNPSAGGIELQLQIITDSEDKIKEIEDKIKKIKDGLKDEKK